MPQPLRPELADGSTAGTLILQDRPQCAMMIGLIAAEWAHLEEQLAHMFAMATAEVLISTESVSLKTQPTAAAAMSVLESLAARLGVIENALERVLPDFSDDFNILAKSIRRCAKGRNVIVHARWAISPRYPDDVIRIQDGVTYTRYVQQDFEDILQRIIDQTGDIANFMFKCQDARVEHAKSQK